MALTLANVRPLQAWAAFLAVFELPEIYKVLTGTKFKDFQARLPDTPAVRRLWATFLALLTVSRISYVFAPDSRAVCLHNAAVHVIEAIFMLPESAVMSGHGPKPMMYVILLNAGLFAASVRRAKSKLRS
mmetsp:Transcript_45732/g.74313  ORF Transcript_45732/g.74313 Transcript_45732/m.74313 type:complete len:130 (+) Transcript_45732:76-465(+)|eukprot:CAMPEP_0115113328 /NCGR_PEP_ID=MMETSP0227-20121206/41285_1 /TAXON_ID=89957 /ORGANISM="Polarella glacialis, Strain CCMP 1383" /LENGTH=129 /DNA_ID=CAMNT_0002513295 /DNA_START=50 /DNA_END=439 /DNA_ORIENTATION=+